MNDDKFFIQDFNKTDKKGLIMINDDSDIIIEQMRPYQALRIFQPQRQKELPILIPINGDG